MRVVLVLREVQMMNRKLILIGLMLCFGLGLALWINSDSGTRIDKSKEVSDTAGTEKTQPLAKGDGQNDEPSDGREDLDPILPSERRESTHSTRLPIPSQEMLNDSLQKLGVSQADLKKIKEELKNEGTHHTPQSYLEVATKVGERVDQLEDPKPLSNCALAPQVQPDFYLPLAALCLSFLNEAAIKRSKPGATESAPTETELGPTWKLYQQTLQSVDPSVRELSTAALEEN